MKSIFVIYSSKLVEGAGFEPAKAKPSDLQSDPFDRSGTPPEGCIICNKMPKVNPFFFGILFLHLLRKIVSYLKYLKDEPKCQIQWTIIKPLT